MSAFQGPNYPILDRLLLDLRTALDHAVMFGTKGEDNLDVSFHAAPPVFNVSSGEWEKIPRLRAKTLGCLGNLALFVSCERAATAGSSPE